MKTIMVVTIGCLLLSVSGLVLAGCGCTSSCGRSVSCEPSSPYTTECQCTDPGANRNPCMSREKYCEAFGNVGAR
jgi:hypothetical protein